MLCTEAERRYGQQWKKTHRKRMKEEEEAPADINMTTARLPNPLPALGAKPRSSFPALARAPLLPRIAYLSPIGDSGQSWSALASEWAFAAGGFSPGQTQAPGPQDIPADKIKFAHLSFPARHAVCRPCQLALEPAGCAALRLLSIDKRKIFRETKRR
ncbi:hypothetical protein GX51_01114 [Blastomyces parvus]|uniref:Uncharacterized protein n=1 Tax=Blastomyces parvus TaxID=2060905 RepID=A0A2B7XI39_9EURO|nr:hypothetical protein GX51_01114 [Blastomyces parvus]